MYFKYAHNMHVNLKKHISVLDSHKTTAKSFLPKSENHICDQQTCIAV